jgi:hypothetical protein
VIALTSPLGKILEACLKEYGLTRGEASVLSPQVEPYLSDTSRAGAEFFASVHREFFLDTGRPCHIRGAHYVIVSVGLNKPDGTPYQNIKSDYEWLGRMATHARWLGLVDPELINDERNDEPAVSLREAYSHEPVAYHGLTNQPGDISISPDIAAVSIEHSMERQPYTLVVYGEKSSLRSIVEPICAEFGADMYLMNGELSITHAYQMAKRAVEDGRRLILFTLTDFDPGGNQMSVSAAHKLRAFADDKFAGELEFDVIPVALTADQVIELNLPDVMLKSTEKRKERWKEEHGREGAEIDALVALHPDFLAQALRRAMEPYFDADLHDDMIAAQDDWREEAEKAIEDQVGEELEALRQEYAPRMVELKACLKEVEDKLAEIKGKVNLPAIVLPDADVGYVGDDGVFISSDMDFREHMLVCRSRKRYGLGADVEAA